MNNKLFKILSLLLVIATLFMSVGYASINSITTTVSGDLIVAAQDGVFISNVNYTLTETEGTTSQKINYYVATFFDSEITLDKNTESSITYEITVYNNSDKDYIFIGVVFDPNLYSNPNIEYSLNGITEYNTVLTSKDSITFTITFKYSGTDISNNTLKSKINFKFEKLPVLKLSNEEENLTLENIYPDYEPQEFQFNVSNYNDEEINTVPMTYTFKTTIDSPLTAKIYDSTGTEVTDSISIGGNGTDKIDNLYTLKIFWDNSNPTENIEYNSADYADKEFTCKVELVATPTSEEYLDYTITKQFGVDITTSPLNFNVDTESSIGMEKEYATLPISITNYNSNNEYNNYDINYEISITGNDKFTYSIDNETATSFARTIEGNKSNTDSYDVLFNADIYSLLESENATVTMKITSPYVKEITFPVTINLQVLNIRFDANGGTVTPTSLTTYKGMTYPTLPTPTWTGHTFDGWFTKAEGGTQVTDTTEVTLGNQTQTLYAHWTSRLLADQVKPGELVNYDVDYSNVTVLFKTVTINIASGYTGWKVLDVVETDGEKRVTLIPSGIPLTYRCPYTTSDSSIATKCVADLTTNFFSTEIASSLTNYKFYKNGFTNVSIIGELQTAFSNSKYTKLDSSGKPMVHAATASDVNGSLATTAQINGTETVVVDNLTDFRENTLFGIKSTSTSYSYVPWYIATKTETYYLWTSYLSGYVVYTNSSYEHGIRPVVTLKATTETTGQVSGVWQLSAVSE